MLMQRQEMKKYGMYRPQDQEQESWSLESSWRRERDPGLAARKFNKLIHTLQFNHCANQRQTRQDTPYTNNDVR